MWRHNIPDTAGGLLLLSGDVELNPGPVTHKTSTCKTCTPRGKIINSIKKCKSDFIAKKKNFKAVDIKIEDKKVSFNDLKN